MDDEFKRFRRDQPAAEQSSVDGWSWPSRDGQFGMRQASCPSMATD